MIQWASGSPLQKGNNKVSINQLAKITKTVECRHCRSLTHAHSTAASLLPTALFPLNTFIFVSSITEISPRPLEHFRRN